MGTPIEAVPPGRPPLLRSTTTLERGQLAVLLVVALVTVGTWSLTVWQARTMDMPMGVVARGAADQATGESDAMGDMAMDGAGEMAASGMASSGWSIDGVATFLSAWTVMMAAMMFPAAAPMLLLFRRVSSQRKTAGGSFVPTWVFAAGYLLVWTAVGGLAWALVRLASDLASRLGPTERGTWAPLVLGAVLTVAGLYQLTPLKRVCLDHCQSPLGFVMTHWRDGRRGALRMGIIHGAYCLGCYWALFAVLVAAGVMSLAWMLLLTLVVFAEKVLPTGRATSRVVGVAFLALAVLVASGAAAMPWSA